MGTVKVTVMGWMLVGWGGWWCGVGRELRGMWPASTAGKPSATELRARVYTAMPVCVYSGVLPPGVRTFTSPLSCSYPCNICCGGH